MKTVDPSAVPTVETKIISVSKNHKPWLISIGRINAALENVKKARANRKERKPEVFQTKHNPHPYPETWTTLFTMRDACAFAVYIELARHFNYKEDASWPSRTTVSLETGYNPSAISRAYAVLEVTTLPSGLPLIRRKSGGSGIDVIRWKVNGLMPQDPEKNAKIAKN